MSHTFNVIRLNRGPKKGQIHIIPNCRQSGYRMRNGRECAGPSLKADCLLSCVSYEAAYWYGVGLLTGMGEKARTPYISPGRAAHWKAMYAEREPSSRRGICTYREDFHADG